LHRLKIFNFKTHGERLKQTISSALPCKTETPAKVFLKTKKIRRYFKSGEKSPPSLHAIRSFASPKTATAYRKHDELITAPNADSEVYEKSFCRF
jgi:hypothetical protein